MMLFKDKYDDTLQWSLRKLERSQGSEHLKFLHEIQKLVLHKKVFDAQNKYLGLVSGLLVENDNSMPRYIIFRLYGWQTNANCDTLAYPIELVEVDASQQLMTSHFKDQLQKEPFFGLDYIKQFRQDLHLSDHTSEANNKTRKSPSMINEESVAALAH